MHTFKTKLKPRMVVEERQTLDAKHNNMISSFDETRNNLANLENELAALNERLINLNNENNGPVMNMSIQRQIWDLDDKKKKIEKDIEKIKSNEDENAYMLKTGKILSTYYKILDTEKQIAAGIYNSNDSAEVGISGIIPIAEQSSIISGNKKKAITDWFSLSADNPIVENGVTGKKTVLVTKKNKEEEKKQETAEKMNKKQRIVLENKDTIYEKYMKTVDKNYINATVDNTDNFDCCPKCMVEMLLNNNTGLLICPKCGIVETIIVDSDKPSFKEPPKEMTSFCYKRINHLNEFLAQFQAKETTNIPEDVYNEIIMEIQKERITNMAKITPKKMRLILKKIHKNDYYEHVPYIINQLNGLPAPVIAPEIEEIIRGMFKAIQVPFEKYCPNKRKNFLSYNYVMYKFFELLELDEYLNCFQLLKSRTKLHQQDQIWKNICLDLNWQFIKSL